MLVIYLFIFQQFSKSINKLQEERINILQSKFIILQLCLIFIYILQVIYLFINIFYLVNQFTNQLVNHSVEKFDKIFGFLIINIILFYMAKILIINQLPLVSCYLFHHQ
ncbi:transmembrane protein, putative (macronuclear) [Tetrahymena thermophila SB210]|uniref:Transmembrane protein, putative n=1 Tax=Tetrahymena thermophila (strain SB210) TaxID=312017 RepID=W7XJG1_TETTS|nr:transmembrane protein, putative [Tetrahymena thermophila SB210]EWS75491.1 transmembrane protein, putative [Tetrahymena thermophila SB210]|eukprot:XP_012651960.1 transmembrane protein, putative [Tetrahymena thermophila SB210]